MKLEEKSINISDNTLFRRLSGNVPGVVRDLFGKQISNISEHVLCLPASQTFSKHSRAERNTRKPNLLEQDK